MGSWNIYNSLIVKLSPPIPNITRFEIKFEKLERKRKKEKKKRDGERRKVGGARKCSAVRDIVGSHRVIIIIITPSFTVFCSTV